MEAFNGYDIDKLLNAIYTGLITEYRLPNGVYERTYESLINAVVEGFAKEVVYNTPNYYLLKGLKNNIYFFSAAKTFQQVRELKGAMVEGDNIISFNDFRKKAETIFKTYNENYLRTEYDTSIGQAQIASKWADTFEDKELFPYMEYSAVIDSRTSEICRKFDGIILPLDDPFWKKYSPLNHFNCFTPETPILTPNGWVRIDEIKKGQLVIGGSGKSHTVNAVHINTIEDEIISISIKNNTISSTKNHRFLTLNGWKRAENIVTDDIIIQNIEIGFFNKAICTINNLGVILRYGAMSFIRKWKPRAINAFNTYIEVRDKNIDKFSVNKVVTDTNDTIRSKEVKKDLFAFGKFFSILKKSSWVTIISVYSFLICLFSNFLIKHGIKLFHSFRSIWSSFSKRWMRIVVSPFDKFFGSVIFSFGGIYPLGFNSFASSSWSETEFFKPLQNGGVINTPSFANHSKSKKLIEVEGAEGFAKGNPLNSFNSLFSFCFHSFFNRKFVLVKKLENINYSGQIYNLSVNIDESYITNVGVVHNCRCQLLKVDKYEHPRLATKKQIQEGIKHAKDNGMQDVFEMNPYFDHQIFSKKHPYFSVPSQYKELAKNNFNLPIPHETETNK